jgi:hypothetical protein
MWASLDFTSNPDHFSDVEALNTIVRFTAGNFRLIDRLFSQIIRIIKINNLRAINKDVVEAARISTKWLAVYFWGFVSTRTAKYR